VTSFSIRGKIVRGLHVACTAHSLLLLLLARRRRVENLIPDVGIAVLTVDDSGSSEFHAEAFTTIETADACARQATLNLDLIIGSEEQASAQIQPFTIRYFMASDSTITTTVEHAILLVIHSDFW